MTEDRIKIIALLWEFFDRDSQKVGAWLRADNLNFGGFKPIQLMENGREHKVLRFIENAQSGDLP